MAATTLIGLVLTAYVNVDFLFTTIGAAHRRFVTMRIADLVYALFRRLPEGGFRHLAVGPVVLSAVALWWVAGIGLGWGLIFAGFEQAVALSDSDRPAGFWAALSHSGHLLSTLGSGITEATGVPFALLGVACAVNGMVVLTLSVSFVLGTTQTVTQGRGLLLLRRVISPGDSDWRGTMLPALATLVSQLNTAPLALYYSHPDLRLPRQLIDRFADEPQAHEILRDLAPKEDLQHWARRYRLCT
jgi:hypothetical protein